MTFVTTYASSKGGAGKTTTLLATCTELLTQLDEAPETPECTRLRHDLKLVQRKLLSAACAFGPAQNTWLAQ